MTLYVKVRKEQAQKVKKELSEKGILDIDYEIVRKGQEILIPVKKKIKGYEIVELESKKRDMKPRTLKSALKGILSDKELELVPKRFDLIGEVAVLDIPDEIKHKSRKIAQALVKIHPTIKTVCMEVGSTEGTFRLKPVEVVLGKRTITEYKESGIRMRLDVSSVYFTPRLSSERLRIARAVSPGERVLVMFAGVGPYTLIIAKNQPKAEIVAVEINPDAVEYMKENIVLNKIKGKIEVYGGDVREIVPDLGKFNRILMPLPKDAWKFLDVTKKALEKGGVVHFYSFSERDEPFTAPIQKIKEIFPEAKIKYRGIVGNISPGKVRVVIDFKT
jgi:tRNA (guanine37-N1)-methyltransferase